MYVGEGEGVCLWCEYEGLCTGMYQSHILFTSGKDPLPSPYEKLKSLSNSGPSASVVGERQKAESTATPIKISISTLHDARVRSILYLTNLIRRRTVIYTGSGTNIL